MKKSFLITVSSLLLVSIATFGYVKLSETDLNTEVSCAEVDEENELTSQEIGPFQSEEFIYRIGHRFNTAVTKSQVAKANSIFDLLPYDAPDIDRLSEFAYNKVDTFPNKDQTYLYSDGEALSPQQKTMLNEMSISSNFFIASNCKFANSESGLLEDYRLVYHITVVPDQSAEYSLGLDSLYNLMRSANNKYMAGIDWERLWPGRVAFCINKKGEVTRVVTEMASGQKDIDANMVELIKSMPGTWSPAKDAQGNPVKQEFNFFYGIEGC
ncbi:MAG: hypothetical protein JXQ87_14640 [Bacteroidia bacterium]